ncbi:MAG TPA: NAD(P)/FAD-dependent oxidoreductase [Gemmatimonadales bacterium]|nr:NAD(P)/FAD-dependent oxidoreductase [Gemmatimonadales bacterium]
MIPTVVIVGGGFGGLNAARALRRAPVNVLLLDRNNYHLFQPLLYQVATAGLEPEEIARPVRAILRDQKNFDFRLVEVSGVDFTQRRLDTSAGPVAYDYLILSHGSQTNFFGLESMRQHGFGLKDIPDALRIRNHVLTCFEQAMLETDPERRRAKLTFIVVGGGPTGVEMAGALSELIRLVLVKDYPRLNIKDVRILLLEATDKILAALPERLREAAVKTLWRKWIEVRFSAVVTDYDGELVRLKSGEVIPARTVIWAAGVQAAPLNAHLGLTPGRQGRIAVEPTLQLHSHPEVFIIGDAAYLDENSQPLPMVAPVAIQMGRHVALNIRNALRSKPLVPFHYRDQGTLATIGRNAAVADVYGIRAKGFPAWVLWLGIHIVQLIGFRNKLFVLLNWAWDYFFYERAARLITRD